MKRFITQCRNVWDFTLYGVKIGMINPYFMTINAFILGYAIAQYEQLREVENLFILLFLIFINLLWQLFSVFQEYIYYLKRTDYSYSYRTPDSNDFSLEDKLSKIYTKVSIPHLNHTIIYSDSVNKIVRGDGIIRLKMSKIKERRVERYIKVYKDLLTPFLNRKWYDVRNCGGSFYNEKKLCMASEIEELSDQQYIVLLNKGCYYNSFLTNNIYITKMRCQEGLDIIPPFHVSTHPIQSLEESSMSDHIGVSTIAISKDGYAVILRHNNRSAVSANKLLPSGSGSVDFRDSQQQTDFKAIIIKAVERELCEETNIAGSLVESSRVIGFYRDLNRGGKPEFCCLTYLSCNKYDLADTITPDRSEQQDDFKLIKISEKGQITLSELENILIDHNKECSLALYMSYFMLCNMEGFEQNDAYKSSHRELPTTAEKQK